MVLLLVVFVLATVIGYRVISKVPSMLHTPLMSGMNALSGITVLGALVMTAGAIGLESQLLGACAIVLATMNIVGGFKVTHRMLKMFKNDGPGKTRDE